MKFFLSYASDADKQAAEQIQRELEDLDKANPHTVFVDYESLRKSDDTDLEINNLLETVDAVLYLVTVSSIRSFWCGKEIGYAQCLGKPIVPIAGCGITGEFIKSQSVPWISGLKWVNWWEKDRARKIVEGVTHERGIIRMLTPEEIIRLSGSEIGGDYLAYGIENTRAFALSDIRTASEVRIAGKGNKAIFYERKNNGVLQIKGNSWFCSILRLDEYERAGEHLKLTSAWIVECLKTQQRKLEDCHVVVLFRYCIGGQRYVSTVFDLPLISVCSPDLRTALEKAAT